MHKKQNEKYLPGYRKTDGRSLLRPGSFFPVSIDNKGSNDESEPKIIDKTVDSSYHLIRTTG